jgi:hypothetical protein
VVLPARVATSTAVWGSLKDKAAWAKADEYLTNFMGCDHIFVTPHPSESHPISLMRLAFALVPLLDTDPRQEEIMFAHIWVVETHQLDARVQ